MDLSCKMRKTKQVILLNETVAVFNVQHLLLLSLFTIVNILMGERGEMRIMRASSQVRTAILPLSHL